MEKVFPFLAEAIANVGMNKAKWTAKTEEYEHVLGKLMSLLRKYQDEENQIHENVQTEIQYYQFEQEKLVKYSDLAKLIFNFLYN